MKNPIAIVGAGRMASALARAYLDTGYAVQVWNRTIEKCKPLEDLGAKVSASLADTISASSIIVVCINDYQTTESIFRDHDVEKVIHGKLVIQLSSGSPDEARSLATWIAKMGADYLDGAIMAPWQYIGQPDCPIIYAGPKATYESTLNHLLVLGGSPYYAGEEVAQACALESAILMQMWGAMFGALQGSAMCAAEGISMDVYERILNEFAPATNGGVKDILVRVRDHKFQADENTLATVETHYSAMKNVLKIGESNNLNLQIPIAFNDIFQKVFKANKGHYDFAEMFNFMKN